MKITLISCDLSGNALGRAYLLAEILGADHQVEIVGSAFGEGIWGPADVGRFELRPVRGRRWPLYAFSLPRLLRRVDGDLVYAVKARPSSYGVALLHRLRAHRPLVLDLDDDEEAFAPAVSLRSPLKLAEDLSNPNGGVWLRRLAPRIGAADALTVASRGLQRRYGGVLVPHAKDTERLRPRPEWVEPAKEALGVAGERVLMFLGTPRPYKGVVDLAVAAGRMRHPVRVVVIGADPGDDYVAQLASYPRVVLRPPSGLDRLPFLLHAADLVVVPQRADPRTALQVPSKVYDAMALALPTVATAVSDLPEILGEGRGVVVPPADPDALAAALDRLLDAPGEAREMGRRARRWCEEHASYTSARETLREVIDRVAPAPERGRAASGLSS